MSAIAQVLGPKGRTVDRQLKSESLGTILDMGGRSLADVATGTPRHHHLRVVGIGVGVDVALHFYGGGIILVVAGCGMAKPCVQQQYIKHVKGTNLVEGRTIKNSELAKRNA